MPDGEGRRVFDADDQQHREFRAEAERLVELWRNQQVDVTEVDLTEGAWTTSSESSSPCSPRNDTQLSSSSI